MKILKTGLVVLCSSAFLLMAGCASDSSNLDDSGGLSLVGTKWHYTDRDWQYDLEFAPDGVLYTTHPNDKSKGNESWEQDGTNVRFYYNNKFSSYTGTLSGNNLMSGTASNKNGANWEWKATRAD